MLLVPDTLRITIFLFTIGKGIDDRNGKKKNTVE